MKFNEINWISRKFISTISGVSLICLSEAISRNHFFEILTLRFCLTHILLTAELTLRNICQNTGFLWHVYSRTRTEYFTECHYLILLYRRLYKIRKTRISEKTLISEIIFENFTKFDERHVGDHIAHSSRKFI